MNKKAASREPDFQAQFRHDVECRIRDLESTRSQIEKAAGRAKLNGREPFDWTRPANCWGGECSTLDVTIRFSDIPEYIEHLRAELRALILRDLPNDDGNAGLEEGGT